MAKNRNREEAINTQLAILISKLGVTADAETIQVHGQHRPDVLFQLRGLRVVIEGKLADQPNAEQVVLGDARKRVRSGVAHIAEYLGTYYTSVSAATLLLKLTMSATWKQDFGDPNELVSFKVADLACGTGTKSALKLADL